MDAIFPREILHSFCSKGSTQQFTRFFGELVNFCEALTFLCARVATKQTLLSGTQHSFFSRRHFPFIIAFLKVLFTFWFARSGV